ncbi:conserved fungal protein [Mucor ambiguus]|uniref:Conserved fungal protein n=1 Tax=Mucor ambiguus TaxID=91626 RepID=A0A0C9MJY6_9FUNG|nr:conserved fungal protein [Mucor ambiguus]
MNKEQEKQQKISESEEYPIFDRLLRIKQRLMVLKKHEKMAPQDILVLQEEFEDTIIELIQIRGGVLFKENHVNNRTDDELHKVCQLISLCFMTIGKWHESPAIFCQVIAIKNCFYQLEQIGIYDEHTLQPYGRKLQQLESLLTEDEQNCALPPPILELVRYNYAVCKRIYDKLLSLIRDMSPTLIPIRSKLLEIRGELIKVAFQRHYDEEDIIPIQEELLKIDNVRGRTGIFLKNDAEQDMLPFLGQGTLVDMLEKNFDACHDLLNVDNQPIVESIRQRLIDIRSDLEGIEMTSKWSLRQTDLFTYQLQLHDVAHMLYKKDEFEGEEGRSMLSNLLAACYNIILNLLGDGPSVAESLLPIYHQLNTLRDCLKRLLSLHCKLTDDEKMLYALKLRSIDIKRENGSFHDEDGLIPEGTTRCIHTNYGRGYLLDYTGQSKCVFALEECYRLIQELSKLDDEDDGDDDSSTSSTRSDSNSDSSSSYGQDEVETQE